MPDAAQPTPITQSATAAPQTLDQVLLEVRELRVILESRIEEYQQLQRTHYSVKALVTVIILGVIALTGAVAAVVALSIPRRLGVI